MCTVTTCRLRRGEFSAEAAHRAQYERSTCDALLSPLGGVYLSGTPRELDTTDVCNERRVGHVEFTTHQPMPATGIATPRPLSYCLHDLPSHLGDRLVTWRRSLSCSLRSSDRHSGGPDD